MNSESDSDWDSMSEAPKPPAGAQQGLILYPPPPPTGTKAAPAQQPKQAVKADKSGGEKSGQQRRNQPEGRQEGAGSRDYSASRDSGIDTATVSSSNLSPTSKTEQFTDIAEDQASPPVHHTAGARGFPCPEEKINLLTFDEIKTQYFQIQFTDEGLMVDRIIPALADCWSKVMSELLGILKIPMILLFVILGHILKILISSLIKPFSDFVLKPVLVSCHNHLLSPVFSLLYNISSMTAMVMSPCCPIQKISTPWVYITENKHQSNPLTV